MKGTLGHQQDRSAARELATRERKELEALEASAIEGEYRHIGVRNQGPTVEIPHRMEEGHS
jgi:hypothetical protein